MMQNIKEDNEQHKVRGLKFAIEHPDRAQKNTKLSSQPFQVADSSGNVPIGKIPVSTQADSLSIYRADSDAPRNDQNVELTRSFDVNFQGMSEEEVYNMFSEGLGKSAFVLFYQVNSSVYKLGGVATLFDLSLPCLIAFANLMY